MKYKCKNITACGKRIKTEAKKRNLSNEDMRKLLTFENVKSVSAVYSGKTISDAVIDILVKSWGVRRDYLLCIDNYATEQDKQNALLTHNQKEYAAILNYLKSLEYDFDINMYWICSFDIFRKEYNVFSEYIAETDIEYFEYCIENLHIFSELDSFMFQLCDFPIIEFCTCYAPEIAEYMEYSTSTLFDTTKENKDSFSREGIIYFNHDNRIQMLYDLKLNNKHLKYLSLNYMRTLFANIDNMCKCSISSMISYSDNMRYTISEYDTENVYNFPNLKAFCNSVKVSNTDLPFQ